MSLSKIERSELVSEIVQATVAALQPQFAAINRRLDSLESRMDALESRMDSLEKGFDILKGSQDNLLKEFAPMKKDLSYIKKRLESQKVNVHRNFDKIVQTAAELIPIRTNINLLEKKQLLLNDRVESYEKNSISKE